MFTAEEALGLGLVSAVTDYENIGREALLVARDFAAKESKAFRSIKMRLRGPVAEEMNRRRQASILEFADIWYSEGTRKNLEKIRIFT